MKRDPHIWTSILAGLVLIFFGTYITAQIDLYGALPHFDKVFHITGGFILAWFLYSFTKKDMEHASVVSKIIFFTGFACIVGIFWEFAERLSTIYSAHDSINGLYHFFHGGDLDDTIGDLLADMLGGLIGGITFALMAAKSKAKQTQEKSLS